MGEIRLDHCCRLCLKEGFSLTNIFSHRSATGDPLYLILNFIYEMKISENDGLPSQICSPCMWRMIEFDACKRNVRSAETEIMRLLNQIRPQMNEVSNHSAILAVSEMAPVKDEVNVLEWGNLIETDMEGHTPDSVQQFEEDDCDDLESTKVEADEVPVEEFQDNCNQQVFCLPLRESSQLYEVPNSLSLENCDDTAGSICLRESSSIITASENNKRIGDKNKWISEKDLSDDVMQAQESLSAKQPKGFVTVTEPGPCHFGSPLSKMNKRFTCDICNKSFPCKSWLGRHLRVHYDDRLFSCSVCSKSFKQDSVRRMHELRHLRDKMSVRENEMRSKKKQYSCGICGKNFGSKSGISGHLIQHSGKYSCSFCGKRFSGNFHLKEHLTVHTKEKPFKCGKCFKDFNSKSKLTEHMVKHSSDKPFSCKFCEKKFKAKGGKDQHELRHLRKKYHR